MTATQVIPIERLELRFAPRVWRFAERRRAEIDAHFAARQRQKPALFNGTVLVLGEHAIDGAVFRGACLPTDYASFLAWNDWGRPEAGVRDCFAQGALRSADGAFLIGVMGPHTANAGRIYFPSGTPDLSDVRGDTVDLDLSVWREMAEETGLTRSDLTAETGWHTVLAGPQIAHVKIMQSRENAEALRARITAFLAQQSPPELSDIRIVRGPADVDMMMPAFVTAFLKAVWLAPR
ncbi:MAG: NUDIX hydrolase [Xanthobacteraceae bacterium]|nr:NUDIX hydrolase [Xanthobacteraceae bacterium]